MKGNTRRTDQIIGAMATVAFHGHMRRFGELHDPRVRGRASTATSSTKDPARGTRQRKRRRDARRRSGYMLTELLFALASMSALLVALLAARWALR